MTASLAILFHSENPSSDKLAGVIIDAIESENVNVECFRLATVNDQLDLLDNYDGFLFSASSEIDCDQEMQRFVEAAARKSKAGSWRDKIAAAFLPAPTKGTTDIFTLIQYSMFSAQHNMVWVSEDIVNKCFLPQCENAAEYHSCTAKNANEHAGLPLPQEHAFRYGRHIARVTKSWSSPH